MNLYVISNINFKCKKHDKEFLYYKNSNYYCSECVIENDLEDYLNLDFIKLSIKEKEEFEKMILESEKIMKEINLMNEKYVQRLINSNKEFNIRNKEPAVLNDGLSGPNFGKKDLEISSECLNKFSYCKPSSFTFK